GDFDVRHWGDRIGLGHRFFLPHRDSFFRCRARNALDIRLTTSTNPSSTIPAAHARAWSLGSGDSASSKIESGIVWSGWLGCQSTALAVRELVNRMGAVSPAIRATASVVPVRIPPIEVGSTTPSTILHRLAPSA